MTVPSDRPYEFHAFDVSYFSAKVRPALRYKRVWYDEIRADARYIKQRTGLAFIPMLITPEDEAWQDSTDIYDRLEARHPEPPLFPATPLQRIAAHLVELYTDEFALIPAMHYRWGSELGEASARARFIAMIGDEEIGTQAAKRMAQARLALGANDDNAPAIEAHTRDLLDALNAHFENHPYLLGERMSFADCALMGPIDGHFFTDLVSRKLLLETARPVVGWIERCNQPNSPEQGTWLANDSLAPTLSAVLKVMGEDAVPLLMACLELFENWADTAPRDQERLPRTIGQVESSLRGLPVGRFVGIYLPFLAQRVLDDYSALDAEVRKTVDSAIAGTGWERMLAHKPRHRLTKRGFEIVFADQ
ncbi:MAG: glutathione S-transferase family protein [Proteobacteria bacterium]|nr:glutathione S-transferase family protein [Pseudomonadota bacterium]